MQFTPLTVVARREEIDGACSIRFEKPAGFDYFAGQHLPIRVFINEQEARRTYTLSSSPLDEHLQITVKRVRNGLVSNYLNDTIQVGSVVEARPPIGHIYIQGQRDNYRTLYLIAAGSGITPMWSIARTVLAQEPHTHVRLFYGNKSEDSIIFRESLEKMQSHYGDRFQVVHALNAPKKDSWSALWRSDVIYDVHKGRIDPAALRWFLDKFRPVSQNCEYFICGPGSMNTDLKIALLQLQVPETDIHVEYFGAVKRAENVSRGIAAQATITLDGKTQRIQLAPNTTVLQAALDAGLDAPYSCQAGICGACQATLTHGKVDMPTAPALDAKQITAGEILTCQSWAESAEIAVKYP